MKLWHRLKLWIDGRTWPIGIAIKWSHYKCCLCDECCDNHSPIRFRINGES